MLGSADDSAPLKQLALRLARDYLWIVLNPGAAVVATVLEWGWIRTREHEKYASAKVSQKGGPFFSRGVASRRRRRRHGREEWCDLSFQK